jgi:hypothetical protein
VAKKNIEVFIPVALEKLADTVLSRNQSVMLAYATAVQAELNTDKPPYPAPGSMEFVSDKQRRFVMAQIREGKIKVPYKRGLRAQTLNKSYRVDAVGYEAYLYSAASYSVYVVGDSQARIHQGRWKTAKAAADTIRDSGVLQSIIDRVR